jgi:asparagine synthase (glutamine-hydrolysing)
MKNLFKYAHHLGFNNPYYLKDKQKFIFDTKFESIISKTASTITLNPKALLSFFNKFYFLADNSIVNEVNRSPWMGVPNKDKTDWNFYNLPQHQNKIKKEESVADVLFELLCEEIVEYVGQVKSVGILLSGGMDSRIVVGCLHHLMQQKRIDLNRVVAYTWGNTDSRDYIYAKRLAHNLDWEFKSYQIGAEEMWNNFMISGIRGCEFSGLHLHAMQQIAETNDVEVMLAGSYGDSVGRAEYFGIKVDKIIAISQKINNKAGLLKPNVFKASKALLLEDINKYHTTFKKEKAYQENEIDKQLHYMRRMLNPCMEVINDKTPLFQIFTSPKVFAYMWSLDVSVRNDKVYYYMLKKFPKEISEVPWARTGKRFMHNEDVPDQHKKKHHNYTDIVQFELYDKILTYVVENKDYLSYINIDAFKMIMKEIKRFPKNNFDYLELACWIVSYTKFAKTYGDLLETPTLFSSKTLAFKAKCEYRILTKARQLKHAIFRN